MSHSPAPGGSRDSAIAQEAAAWIARLSTDDPHEREAAQAGFTAWKQRDPRHAQTAAGMERLIEQMRTLRDTDTFAGLAAGREDPRARGKKASPRRRNVALAIGLLIPAVFAARLLPAATWLADARTATGEQREQRLADGTRLTLGTASAVNISLQPDLRRVELVSGEILVDVAKDSTRPLVVDTVDGRIRALGTRFIVRRNDHDTRLTMLESTAVASAGAPAPSSLAVTAGAQARLSIRGVEQLLPVDAGLTEDAFRAQRLLVRDQPLPDVLDELARHRPGVIRYERGSLSHLRVSAVLPLDDTDRALQLLLSNFPTLRVRTVTPWVVLIDTVPSAG